MGVDWRRFEAIRRAAEIELNACAKADRILQQVEQEGGLDGDAQRRLMRDVLLEFLLERCDADMQEKLIRAFVVCRTQRPMMAVRG
ncbi:MAG: hypothetical protein GWN84_12435 [Gammaproteobacteria bacterium]|nr:hypothetical protein [Gammaproteobacteria bacterium]NIR83714.1 hypothetical protein [Gammaproteobacteria bacterium]NIR91861.1 hypothetical protein [Gammaproteobacteria bacterium]NIU04880.1 hypothetical protein [Gammaproteobacteria bacterium]NIV51862.1 hypothetical protein [Gammaproteobacteria bacterium]